ncbi:unnamed protein product [Diamesa hyperborea]
MKVNFLNNIKPEVSFDETETSCLSDEGCYHEEIRTDEDVEECPSFDITEFSSLSFLKDRKFYTEYSYEIINTLFLRETSRIQCHFRSTQIEFRPEAIDFMKFLCNHHGFTKNTLHLAMFIFDIYCDSYRLPDILEHQKLVASVILLLAAKSEDIEATVPPLKTLLNIIDLSEYLEVDFRCVDKYSTDDINKAYTKFSTLYLQLEFIVFQTMEFNIISPTICTFLDIFSNIVVTNADFEQLKSLGCQEYAAYGDLKLEANRLIMQFEDICLGNLEFINIKPSLIAASVIASTRKILKIPLWTSELVTMTRYDHTDMRDSVIELIHKRMRIVYDTKTGVGLMNDDSGISTSHIDDNTDVELTSDECLEVVEQPYRKKRRLQF